MMKLPSTQTSVKFWGLGVCWRLPQGKKSWSDREATVHWIVADMLLATSSAATGSAVGMQI